MNTTQTGVTAAICPCNMAVRVSSGRWQCCACNARWAGAEVANGIPQHAIQTVNPTALSDKVEVRLTPLPHVGVSIQFHPMPSVLAAALPEVMERLQAAARPFCNLKKEEGSKAENMVALSKALRTFLEQTEALGQLAPPGWRDFPLYAPLLPGPHCDCGVEPEDRVFSEAIAIRNPM